MIFLKTLYPSVSSLLYFHYWEDKNMSVQSLHKIVLFSLAFRAHLSVIATLKLYRDNNPN